MVGQPTTSRQIPGRSWPGALKMCSGPIFSRLSARSDAFEDRLIPRDHSRRRTDSPGRDTRQEYRNKSLHLEVISRQLANRHNGKKGGAGVRRIHGNAGDRRYREFRRLCPLRHQPLLQPLLRRGRPPCRQSPHLLALHEACLGLELVAGRETVASSAIVKKVDFIGCSFSALCSVQSIPTPFVPTDHCCRRRIKSRRLEVEMFRSELSACDRE